MSTSKETGGQQYDLETNEVIPTVIQTLRLLVWVSVVSSVPNSSPLMYVSTGHRHPTCPLGGDGRLSYVNYIAKSELREMDRWR